MSGKVIDIKSTQSAGEQATVSIQAYAQAVGNVLDTISTGATH